MKSIYFVIYLCFVVTVSNSQNLCNSKRFVDSVFTSSQIKKDSNIVYAKAKNEAGQLQDLQLDVYYPQLSADTMSKRPLVILIHGGAFMAGNRNDMAFQCREYAKRGYVAATLTYRLGWGCTASDGLGVCLFCQGLANKMYNSIYRATQDARAATRYLVSNAATFKVDTSKIFIGGESAGSITALATAFWTQAEADRFCSINVRNAEGGLDTVGNSLKVKYTFKGIINNCGAIDRDSSIFDENIPITSFHDDLDCTVPYGIGRVISCCSQSFPYASGSSIIHDKLKNRPNRYSELHWVQNSLNHCSYPPIQVVKKASCFMQRVMCGNLGQSFAENTVWSNPTCRTTSVSEHTPSVFAKVFPNPVTDVLNISIEKQNLDSEVYLSIDNVLGHNFLSQKFKTTTFEIPEIKNFAKGIYFISLETEGKKIVQRLIKN